MKILPVILKPDRYECNLYNEKQIILAFNFFSIIKNNKHVAQYAFEFTCGLRKKYIKNRKVTIDDKISYSYWWLNKYITNEKILLYNEYAGYDLDLIIKGGMSFLNNRLIFENDFYITTNMWQRIYGGLLDASQPWVKDVLNSLTSDKSKVLLYVNNLSQEQIRFFKIIIRYLFSEDYPNILNHKARKSILHIPEEDEIDACLKGLGISDIVGDIINEKS